MVQYKDLSASTAPSVTSRRSRRRRGIVIHTTMGYDSLAWLQGGSALVGRPASCDFLIARSGDILRLTRRDLYSYHSGRAIWNGYQEPDTSINQGFIGIEIEAAEHKGQQILNIQYIALAHLTSLLMRVYHINVKNVCLHKDCALPKGRKSDPRDFHWWILQREQLHPSEEASHYGIDQGAL